jgi:hypothetical protein
MARSNPSSNQSGVTGGFTARGEKYIDTAWLQLASATQVAFKIKRRAQIVGSPRTFPGHLLRGDGVREGARSERSAVDANPPAPNEIRR